MKLRLRTSSCFLVIMILLIVSGPLIADELTASLVSMVLQSFDPDDPDARTWELFPSKFGYDQGGNSLWENRYVDGWPEGLFGKNKSGKNYQVLGLHGKFLRKGYNYVEIVPGTGEGESFKPEPITLPGRISILDLWVWGSNHNYYLEAHIRDYRGVDYVLHLGGVNFIGWKNLSVRFPGSILQSWGYLPKFRQLSLTKLVLWTRPEEKVDDFYMYIDQIKVLTDLFESRYDGDELAELDKVQEIWGSATD